MRTVIGEAPMLRRIAAFIIDLALLNIIFFYPFQHILNRYVTQDFSLPNKTTIGDLQLIFLVISGVALAYFIIFEYKLKQTPGKHLMNISVQGKTAGQFVIRNIYLLMIVPLFVAVWLVELLAFLFTGKRVLERLSKTKTVMEHKI